jgi:hypothetical protein
MDKMCGLLMVNQKDLLNDEWEMYGLLLDENVRPVLLIKHR